MRRFPSAGTLVLSFAFLVSVAGAACSGSSASDATGNDSADGGSDGGQPSTGDGGGPGFSSALSIIVEPSDKGAALLAAIKGATKSIHMTMYLLTDNSVINALIERKGSGVDVEVVLNQNFPSGQGNSNATTYQSLHNTNQSMVVYAPSQFTYTHEKCIIIDGTSAWIDTMNESYSSPTANREYLSIDTDPADIAEADAIFNADFTNTAITPTGNLLVAPDNDKARIRALIGTATTSIDLEVEELSDADVVSDLGAMADAGAKIRIVLSTETPSSAQNTGVTALKTHSNISLVTTATPYIHAKAIIVDGTRMYVGSANLTENSMDHNRELGLVTASSDVIASVQTAIDTDFGAGSAL